MVHIILLVLKIIGIVLLCILGFVLLSVCCALFVPVRYRIEVTREEGEGNPPFIIRAKVTWLLHLVNILVCYPAEVYVRARVFLFTLFRIPEAAKKKQKTGRKKRSGKKERDKAKEPEDPEPPHGESNGRLTVGAERSASAETTGSLAVETETETDPEEACGLFRRIFRKIQDFVNKIKQILSKIQESLKNIQYTIRRLCDKIKSTSDTIKYYCEVLQGDAFRGSWSLCKEQIGVILKALRPDKFEADLVVGTDDPASTGELLALYGMMYPWIGQHVRIEGDFERSRIEGHLYLKGKIRAFTFLRIAVKVYRNKDIKALIKLFKKEAV